MPQVLRDCCEMQDIHFFDKYSNDSQAVVRVTEVRTNAARLHFHCWAANQGPSLNKCNVTLVAHVPCVVRDWYA